MSYWKFYTTLLFLCSIKISEDFQWKQDDPNWKTLCLGPKKCLHQWKNSFLKLFGTSPWLQIACPSGPSWLWVPHSPSRCGPYALLQIWPRTKSHHYNHDQISQIWRHKGLNQVTIHPLFISSSDAKTFLQDLCTIQQLYKTSNQHWKWNSKWCKFLCCLPFSSSEFLGSLGVDSHGPVHTTGKAFLEQEFCYVAILTQRKEDTEKKNKWGRMPRF